ncbi:MAG: serine hydrolase [Ferruginibacter sp.]|nr:serine hydrolase [Ferruginibacter sp.]
MVQAQKGLINPGKNISDCMAEFSKNNGNRISIRQLVRHTSGMPNYDTIKDFFPKINRQSFTRAEYLKLYMDSALVFGSGTNYYYSSRGYFTFYLQEWPCKMKICT